MAEYKNTHTCGCERTHDLYGKHVDRDRKVVWLVGSDCLECLQARENVIVAEQAQASGCPDLIGSPKQIAFGAARRLAWSMHPSLAKIERIIATTENTGDRSAEALRASDFYREVISAAHDLLRTNTSAKFWLETEFPRGRIESLLNAERLAYYLARTKAEELVV